MTMEELMKEDPSIKRFSIEIPWRNNLLGICLPIAGKLNQDEFEGHQPETLWFGRINGPENGKAHMVFYGKPQSWNRDFREDLGTWEEIRHTVTHKTPYETVDFAILAALIPK